ncbi:MAG: hypothetical protein ABSD72_09070 [Terracidiphilus sp.]
MKIKDHDAVIEEVTGKQSNTLWPDTMKNSSGVDEFLWKGDPSAPLVQRIGAWIFGLVFILCGLAWFDAAYEKHSRVFGVLSIPWFFIGGRIFLNGFRKRGAAKHKSE